jgi:hypothetical protein
MFLASFVDGVEVAQAIEEDIEGTLGTAHIEGVAAGETSSVIPYTTLLELYGQRKRPWILNCI